MPDTDCPGCEIPLEPLTYFGLRERPYWIVACLMCNRRFRVYDEVDEEGKHVVEEHNG